MLPTKQLSNNVIKIISDSNCYIIENKYIVDTSSKHLKKELLETIKQYIDPKDIQTVIFTHLHYDHISCFDLFKNAKFYANKIAVDCMNNKQDKINMILNSDISKEFSIELNNIEDNEEILKLFKIFNTPGHTSSEIILYYEKDNILFTGDMYFKEGCYGRTDLPNSEPEKMLNSIKLTLEVIEKYEPIIASGHDY